MFAFRLCLNLLKDSTGIRVPLCVVSGFDIPVRRIKGSQGYLLVPKRDTGVTFDILEDELGLSGKLCQGTELVVAPAVTACHLHEEPRQAAGDEFQQGTGIICEFSVGLLR